MKNQHAQSLGALGGKARASRLTKEQRREIAKKAGIASGKKRAKKAQKFYQKIKKNNEKIVKEFKLKPLICKNS